MKYTIVIIAVIILLGNQKSFSQSNTVKGHCVNYEYGGLMPGVSIGFLIPSGEKYIASTDNKGKFEIKMNNESEYLFVRFIGCYVIKILNIPQGIKLIDFGEIKMVENYGLEESQMDGTPAGITPENRKEDERFRKDILKNCRINVLGKELKPYFEGKYLIFDYNNGKKRLKVKE